jgi:tRNA-dihydrouridine synthase 2
MGAALLSVPETACEILRAMTEVSSVPVSCKIRVLNKTSETLELAQMLEKCGISAIGVHGRRREERPKDQNRPHEINEVVRSVGIPVIANGSSGEINEYSHIERFRQQTGASSTMIARKASTNPSIFSPKGMLSMQAEIENFLDKSCEFDENYTNTKYVVQRMLGSEQEFDPRGKATVNAGTVLEICRAWSKENTYYDWKNFRLRRSHKRKPEDMDVVEGIRTADISFAVKKLRHNRVTPKCALFAFCDEKRIARPTFQNFKKPLDGRYEAVVEVDGKKFTSRISQANKKMAEQVR